MTGARIAESNWPGCICRSRLRKKPGATAALLKKRPSTTAEPASCVRGHTVSATRTLRIVRSSTETIAAIVVTTMGLST